jgi:drug/metabolite transporter (DMT)-like permease
MKENWKAHVALVLVNLLYAASHLIAKDVMPTYLTPNVFILLRVSGGCLLFWLLFRVFSYEKVEVKDLLLLAICGLFGVAINQLFFFHGLNNTSAINAGIIMAFNPIMVVVLAYFILKDQLHYRQIIGIVIGATGAVLLTINSFHTDSSSFKGDLFLVINSFSYALYLIAAKPLMAKYRPLTVITWVFTFGLFFVMCFPPVISDVLSTDFRVIPLPIVGVICYVIVGVTFLTYLLTMYGLKYVGPTVSSTYIYLQPIMVIVFTALFTYFDWTNNVSSSISFLKMTLMLLIFIGVYFANFKNNKA